MAYATVAQVQGRLRTGLITIGATSEPSTATVTEWLEEVSAWIDATLAWRYVVPVTDSNDKAVLRRAATALVAGMVLKVLAASGGDVGDDAEALMGEGLTDLVYQPGSVKSFVPGVGSVVVAKDAVAAGRSLVVLPNTAESDSGEAAVDHAAGSFSDPDAEEGGVNERLFEIGREDW